MLNPAVIKKTIGLSFMAIFPLIGYVLFMLVTGNNIFAGIVAAFVTGIFAFYLANNFLDHPFRSMSEGRGLLALNLNSTGIIQPFILQRNVKYLTGKVNNNKISRLWNRRNVLQVKPPINGVIIGLDKLNVEETSPEKVEELLRLLRRDDATHKDRFILVDFEGYDPRETDVIIMPRQNYKDIQLALEGYTAFIYNDQTKDFITKTDLQNLEMKASIFNKLEYASEKADDLGRSLRDFGRMVMTQIGVQFSGIFENKIVQTLIIGAIVVVVLYVLYQVFGGAVSIPGIPAPPDITGGGGAITPTG